MRFIYILFIGMMSSLVAFGQSTVMETNGKGYRDYSIFDNTFAGVNAGISLIANGDQAKSVGKNISPIVNINAGLHFSPYFSGRLQFGYARQKAWANNFNTTFADRPGVYQFKMNLFTSEIDIMLDLLNAINGYKPGQSRFFSLYPLIGAGWAHSMANHTNSDDLFFTAGLIGKFQINDKFDVNVEYADKFMPAAIEGWYNGHPCHNYMSLTVGLAYKIRNRGYRLAYAPQPEYDKYEMALDDLNNKIAQLEQELDAKNAEILRLLREKGVTAIPDMSVFFRLDSHKVTKEGELILAQYAKAINETPENVTFRIYGYCDLATGSRKYNEKLKTKRAEAVAKILHEKYGVASSKLVLKDGDLDNPPYPKEADRYSRVVILEVIK